MLRSGEEPDVGIYSLCVIHSERKSGAEELGRTDEP